MAGRELGFPQPNVQSWKEKRFRTTLRNVRLQGHTYVDLREAGKSLIFFCTLCLTPCYSETVLFDHLGGNLHKERLSAAKATLLKQNPWPFDDGVLFFGNSDGFEESVPSQETGKTNSLDDLAVVVHSNASNGTGNGHTSGDDNSVGDCDDEEMVDAGRSTDFVITGIIWKERLSDLRVKLMGYGQISARFLEKDGVRSGIQRIWCEWLGKKGNEHDDINTTIPLHDFAIVTFAYYYELGKLGLCDEKDTLLLTSGEEDGEIDGSSKRKKSLFSDTEDASETSRDQCDSSGVDSALLLDRYDDQLVQSRIISNKSIRRELRMKQRAAAEKMCDICQQKMLPQKDVATLLNLKTGRLACCSRNLNGVYHVCHTSCLIHWILLCESEMFTNPPVNPNVRRRSKRWKSDVNQHGKDSGSKVNDVERSQSGKVGDAGHQLQSVFCSDCQGSGIEIEGDELERLPAHLSELFKYKIKVSDGRRAWMKCPEDLDNCSTGFSFSLQADNAQEKVQSLKLLRFYRADES